MTTHAEGTEGTIGWKGFRLSWGAIIAGLVIATVVQAILALLGLAIGFGAMEFGQNGQALESFGIGAGIWAVLSALISLFLGGLAAGHLAGSLSRLDGIIHGSLVWGLSLVLTLWAFGAGVGALLGGVFGVAGQTLTAAVGGATEVSAAVLRQPGQVTQITGAEGEEEMIRRLQEQTGLNRQQAEDAVATMSETQREFQLGAEEVQQQAPQVAEDVAGTISTAAWWALLASVLSLFAAAGGALVTAEE